VRRRSLGARRRAAFFCPDRPNRPGGTGRRRWGRNRDYASGSAACPAGPGGWPPRRRI